MLHIKHNAVGHIWKEANFVWDEFNKIMDEKRFPGHMHDVAPCKAPRMDEGDPVDMAGRFYKAAYRNGVSLYATSYVNFSHKHEDLVEVLQRLSRAVDEL